MGRAAGVPERRDRARWPRHITLFWARSRLYRNETLQPNTHFFRFFEIYKTICVNFQNFAKFCEKSANFAKISTFFCKNPDISQNFAKKILRFFTKFAEFSKNQLDSSVDLEKPEKMRIWLQSFVSIQPRTSPEKSDVSWPIL